MDWRECCAKRIIKDVKSDEDMIKSLIKTSKNKLESEKKLPMNEITAVSKFTLAYDSLRELLEALTLKYGYKIYNHECFSAFLKEMIKKGKEGDEFNEIRLIRNDVNYYGKDISVEEAEDIIERIKKLRIFIPNLLENFQKGKIYKNRSILKL